MTTKNSIITKLFFGAGLVIALSFMSGCATSSSSGDQMKPMKGGEHMLMLQGINTQAEAEAVNPDDSIAMVCTKCKTVWTSRVVQGVKGAQLLTANGQPTELIGTHGCPGCGGTWTIVGHGKGSTSVLKHTCSVCGDDSGFCCATKPGSAPTHGMETK